MDIEKYNFEELTCVELTQINGGGWLKYGAGFLYETIVIGLENFYLVDVYPHILYQ